MQDTPLRNNTAEQDYHSGYARILRFAEQASQQGWDFSERQIIREIIQRERAAYISEKSSLPIVGSQVRSAAWNRGQADAFRHLLRVQREQLRKE
ncbi:MAG TPA: hypothetical protein VHZ51_14980 [Ktedonobacteraceae bacterium]|jgi:hypothetical protein|nr:hypothetical protein [Ktedonobacteraceae bacterium]